MAVDGNETEVADPDSIGQRRCESIGAPASSEILTHGVIIPRLACASIAKLAGCTIRIDGRINEAKAEARLFAHKLIDATFPAYERVIPAPSPNAVEVDRAELIAALDRLLCVTTREKRVMRIAGLEWGDDGELRLALPNRDVALDAVPAVTTGSAKFGAQVGLLVDLLDAIGSERITLDDDGSKGAIRITDPGDDDLVSVLMQCRV